MPKRKRAEGSKTSFRGGRKASGMALRSVINELVSASSERDTEWRYDEEEGEGDNPARDNLVGQTFSTGDLDWTREEAEEPEEEDGYVNGYEEEGEYVNGYGLPEGELNDDEGDVEPLNEALGSLHSVRTEAELLPSLTVAPQQPPT